MINLQELNTFEKISDIDAIQVKGGEIDTPEIPDPPELPFPLPFPPPVNPDSATSFINGFFGSFNALVGLF